MEDIKQSIASYALPTSDDDSLQTVGAESHGVWLCFLTKVGWYSNDMPHAEKRLVLKLDLIILVFGCLSFFTKYLDQQAITNAYVSYV